MMIHRTMEDYQFFLAHPTCTWDERSGKSYAEVLISQGAKTSLWDSALLAQLAADLLMARRRPEAPD